MDWFIEYSIKGSYCRWGYGNPVTSSLQGKTSFTTTSIKRFIIRLNSGITNTDNFFDQSIFHHQKFENESAAHADSGDTKIYSVRAGK